MIQLIDRVASLIHAVAESWESPRELSSAHLAVSLLQEESFEPDEHGKTFGASSSDNEQGAADGNSLESVTAQWLLALGLPRWVNGWIGVWIGSSSSFRRMESHGGSKGSYYLSTSLE